VLFFYLLVAAKGVTADITVPICIAESGRPFGVDVEVVARGQIPFSKVRAVIRYGERTDRRMKKEKMILRCEKTECTVTIHTPGCYTFSLCRIRIYDLTGLFYLTKKCDAQTQVIVFPELEAIPVILGERVRNFFGDADIFDDLRPGYDPGEMFGIREFRDGDRLQNVYWKLSAKTDELIVKENSLPKACPAVCFFAPGRKNREKTLGRIASISYSLMDAGCPHFAVWKSAGSNDILRTRVDDEESYYMFLTAFLQDAVYETPQNLKAEYLRKYRGEHYLHEISIDADGNPEVDGNVAQNQRKGPAELILR
jgi:uncharacterized protein (DUF58 family)